MIRVVLPTNLQILAKTGREVEIQMEGEPTLGAVLDALEDSYPALRGTMRDHATKERRAFIRFFACGEDWSHEPPEARLPEEVVSGAQVLRVVGALAGG